MRTKFYLHALAAMLVACFATTSAEARKPQAAAPAETSFWSLWSTPAPAASERRVTKPRASHRAAPQRQARGSFQETPRSSGLGPRPAKWCGWYMRTQLGGGPEYNIAANWRRYGSPGSPQVGAVVVWSHHVGIITGQTASGQWIVKSGNYSGRVHEGPRSIAGATVRV
jgi:hypothetical protein